MDFSTMFRVSGSALGAQKQRLEVIAQNLAGANVTRTEDGGPYRRKDVVLKSFSEHLSQAQGAGKSGGARMVKAEVVEDNGPFKNVYNPGHPDANAEGYVQMPNVNVMEEMASMISATRSYEANVKVIAATKGMIKQAMEIGR